MTYAERIERVARAIYETPGRLLTIGIKRHEFAELDEVHQEDYRAQARAADRAVLEAIREPTEEMLESACNKHKPGDDCVRIQSRQAHWHTAHAAIPRGDE